MVKNCILLIENDAGIRGLLVLYLNSKGYHVIVAKDSEEALLLAASEPLHLIVLDIEMPKMNVHKLCERMQGKVIVPIIITGSRRAILHHKKTFDYEKVTYIMKPFEFKMLYSRINTVLSNESPL